MGLIRFVWMSRVKRDTRYARIETLGSYELYESPICHC